jgi:DNA-binding transcriptional LysR family regulator
MRISSSSSPPVRRSTSASDPDIPEAVTPADVDRRSLISEFQRAAHPRMSRSWMQAGGFEPRPALAIDNIEARIAAVAAGLGMGFIPRPTNGEGPSLEGTVLRPLDPPLVRTLGLVERRDKPDNPALRAVREAIMTLSNLHRPEARAEPISTDDVRSERLSHKAMDRKARGFGVLRSRISLESPPSGASI